MAVKIDGTLGLLQNYAVQSPTTGFSYTFTLSNVLLLTPAGTLATGTITMPASPLDGMTVSVTSTQTITALTVSANTGQSIVGAPTTIAANGSYTFIYRASNTTWYQANSSASNAVSAYVGSRGQAFTGNGTFTIPTGVTAVKVTAVGGCGGGGGSTFVGGGGGAGGGATSYLTGLTPGNTISVTIGGAGSVSAAGGNTTVASGTQTISTITANGGAAGVSAATGLNFSAGAGGDGGSASGGQVNVTGQKGGMGMLYTTSGCVIYTVPGNGGSTVLGTIGGTGNTGGSGATAGNAGLVIFEW